ncbi:cysteine-rich secretory protein 3-like [Discoglossus pictus]
MSCKLKEVQDVIVTRHNELRASVDPPPANMLKMEWNEEAAETAAIWAKQCTHCHSRAEERLISRFGCGENLYMANRPHSWKKAMQGWFDEYKDFIFGKGGKTKDSVIGHYTQGKFKEWPNDTIH